MAKVGALGLGAFLLLIFLIILIVLLVLYIIKVPAMKYIFWIYLILYIIAIVILFTMPFKSDPKPEQTNPHFSKIFPFGIFIFLGFFVSVIVYFYVVLVHEDNALVLPKYQ